MTFHVGQEVTRIEKGDWKVIIGPPRSECDRVPEFGEVLTISEIETIEGLCCLSFVGFPAHCAFAAHRFRPVIKTGMEILRAIAADPKPLVEEPEYEGIPFTG